MIQKIIAAVGGRKVLLTLLVITIGVGIDLLAPAALSSNLLTLLITSIGVFAAGNGLEHIATSKSGPNAMVAEVEAIQEKLDTLLSAPIQTALSRSEDTEKSLEEIKKTVKALKSNKGPKLDTQLKAQVDGLQNAVQLVGQYVEEVHRTTQATQQSVVTTQQGLGAVLEAMSKK